MSDPTDRRSGPRIPLEMWVEESTEDEMYFQRGANLSVGGLFLENTVPHPVGTQVTLAFSLPGTHERVSVRGEIVNARSGTFGMGVKFIDLTPADRERIERFVAGRDRARRDGGD